MAQPIDLSRGFLQERAVDAFGADTGGRTMPHTGWDWAPNKPGEALPVYAVEAGTVFYVGGGKADRSGPGINVRVQQPSGYWLYGHLSRADVRNGQQVRAGQQIGLMGSSGGANGVHLHISRFTTKAAALANAVPSQRAGRTVAAWAAANHLADPLPIIQRGVLTMSEAKQIMKRLDELWDHISYQHNVTRGGSWLGWIKKRLGGSYSGEDFTKLIWRAINAANRTNVTLDVDADELASVLVDQLGDELAKDVAQAVVDETARRLKD